MRTIKSITQEDRELLKCWWRETDQSVPTDEMMPLDTTFISYKNDVPMVAATLYLTNSKQMLWIDNFIGNPNQKDRKESTRYLLKYFKDFAKGYGYKSLFCMGEKDKLKGYYMELGFTPTVDVTCFTMGVK